MNQPTLFDEPSKKLLYFAGYAWGMPFRGTKPFCSGVVVAPKWSHLINREAPEFDIILDNGAFGAFKSGVSLEYEEQCEELFGAMNRIDNPIRWMVAPDVVGDSNESLDRLERFRDDYPQIWEDQNLLIAVQDKGAISNILDMIDGTSHGFFVGGAKQSDKKRMTYDIRHLAPSVYCHVGRISRVKDLMWARQLGVDSFDTTSYMRQQKSNLSRDYVPRLTTYAKRVR